MARKLGENDGDIRAVAAAMAADEAYNRTLLVVMGDHGMTTEGDHGGGTPEETDSFLLAYHPRAAAAAAAAAGAGGGVGAVRAAGPGKGAGAAGTGAAGAPGVETRANGGDANENARNVDFEFEVMPQINFAPTLSLILGLPIPFGNLGAVPRRFWDVANAGEMFLEPFRASAGGEGTRTRQRQEEQYAKVLEVTAAQVWRYLQQYALAAGNPFTAADWLALTDMYAAARSAELAGGERTRLFALFLSTAAEVAREQWVQFGLGKMALGLTLLMLNLALHVSVLRHYYHAHAAPASVGEDQSTRHVKGRNLAAVVGGTVVGGTGPRSLGRAGMLEAAGVVSLTALGSACRLSNSFIVAEGDAVHFFVASIAMLCLVRSLSSAGGGGVAAGGASTGTAALAAAGLLMCNAALQALGASWAKEGSRDDGKEAGMEAEPSTHNSAADPNTPTLVLMLGALAMLPWVCHRTLAPAPGGGLRVTVAAAFAAVGARVLLTRAGMDAFRHVVGQHSADVLDAAAAGALPWGVYWSSLLAVLVLAPTAAARAQSVRAGVVGVSHGTVWSVMPVLVMLAGERGALWGLLAVTQVACLVLAVTGGGGAEKGCPGGRGREATLACAWHLMASQLFYAGGHRCAFDGLHFACAFTGFKHFNFYVMGVLLATNTWGGDIVACATLPAAAAAMVARRAAVVDDDAAFPPAFRASLARLALGYSLLRTVGLVVSTAFVAAMRRHLMVWAIFAPKFAFEACGMCVSELLLVLGVVSGLRAANKEKKE
jgi:phosphatidylinositol glycan class O